MMSMVERVARAIYREFENRPLYAQAQMNVVIAEECARAAIEEMRDGEMTDAMYFAACDEMDAWTDPTDGECIKAVFKAALDAALNEQVAG
jgi:hypothetical protein